MSPLGRRDGCEVLVGATPRASTCRPSSCRRPLRGRCRLGERRRPEREGGPALASLLRGPHLETRASPDRRPPVPRRESPPDLEHESVREPPRRPRVLGRSRLHGHEGATPCLPRAAVTWPSSCILVCPRARESARASAARDAQRREAPVVDEGRRASRSSLGGLSGLAPSQPCSPSCGPRRDPRLDLERESDREPPRRPAP